MKPLTFVNAFLGMAGIISLTVLSAMALGVHDPFWPGTLGVAAGVIYAFAITQPVPGDVPSTVEIQRRLE